MKLWNARAAGLAVVCALVACGEEVVEPEVECKPLVFDRRKPCLNDVTAEFCRDHEWPTEHAWIEFSDGQRFDWSVPDKPEEPTSGPPEDFERYEEDLRRYEEWESSWAHDDGGIYGSNAEIYCDDGCYSYESCKALEK